MSAWEFFFGFTAATKAKFPFLFREDDIDRHKCSRVVSMRVLSLGMSRTGTASMQKALTILGFPTSHGFDMHENPRDCDMWMEAYNAKYFGDRSIKLDGVFWDKLLGHVSGVTDTPANCFGPELIAAYPNAKVVLIERDFDKWFPSFEQAVIAGTDSPAGFKVMQAVEKKYEKVIPVVWRGVMQGQFHASNSKEFRENAKEVYGRHYAEIREVLKDQPERLLEFQLDQGWEPLCAFLGKPVPDVPFPKVNEGAEHDEMLKVVYTKFLRDALGLLLRWTSPIVVASLAWRLWKAL
ncbi:hypothetical protein M409DRAFT_66227 [Zasmidium cellare ATCC 36951]|uniref:P-loop containing nucleoside triphosphate hydrolase protein n=1 Tax=Zasmidium cellare ATCC 36951 TaxID=1080233 RepID=A0A6A6CNZ3_ZASCE|nr:uncharacterized protein M409DRAFT_66227 [Zasmidium cellare ATCC 36951]KAF2167196.1 hypothetical protein M409DRAFT_66227 [Zasmidium cellare ATCC 36951]